MKAAKEAADAQAVADVAYAESRRDVEVCVCRLGPHDVGTGRCAWGLGDA